jgi:hypothetical protein
MSYSNSGRAPITLRLPPAHAPRIDFARPTMGHTLTHSFATARAPRRERVAGDDPLDAARGILLGLMLSVLGFWLPLALVFTQ